MCPPWLMSFNELNPCHLLAFQSLPSRKLFLTGQKYLITLGRENLTCKIWECSLSIKFEVYQLETRPSLQQQEIKIIEAFNVNYLGQMYSFQNFQPYQTPEQMSIQLSDKNIPPARIFVESNRKKKIRRSETLGKNPVGNYELVNLRKKLQIFHQKWNDWILSKKE